MALSRGLDVVDVKLARGRGSHLVRVFVDRSDGGVDLADLQSVSSEISTIMDVEDPIRSAYRLEISSPGLDRPLRSEADFSRCIGRLVSMKSRGPIEGRRDFEGRVESVDAEAVCISSASQAGATIIIPLASIEHARLSIDFAPGCSGRQKRFERNKR
ncbi:MAG: ribosome maturation factor RimP [Vicinamibacteria bacterium]|nr:ribosome maturation factor RimP [Vicinamibacteria bacterium]